MRPPPTTLPPTTPKPTEFVCEAVADVAFLVDSSGSIGRRNWVKMLDFLKDMVRAFNVGPDKTHIAVIAYSTKAKVELKFNTLTGSAITEEGYNSLISRIRFQRGFTFIDKALILAETDVFTPAGGMRREVPQIAIVITDGKQTKDRGPYRELTDASSGLKYNKVVVYSLGIGSNLDQQQLEDIASSKSKVFFASSFAALKPVAQTIVQNSCPASARDPCETHPCKAPYNIGCRVVNDESECICPTCPASSNPVCASDDVQDPSECFTRREACLTSNQISVASRTACVPDCRIAADIAFIVDSSGSIGKTNWERTKRFLKRIVSKLDIGPTTTHVAAISYSTNPETVMRFNTLQGSNLNVAEVNKILDGLQWQRGFTFIDKALERAAQGLFTTARGMRSNVPKIAFVITDGKQTKTGQYTPLSIASKYLKDKGVQMIAIGVGNRNTVDYTELLDIASQDDYVYLVESFDELQNPGQARIFRQRVCRARPRFGR